MKGFDIVVKFYCPEYEDITFNIRPTIINIIDGKRVIKYGKSIEFKNNLFETDDQEAIDYLREHKWFGKDILEGNYVRYSKYIDGVMKVYFELEPVKVENKTENTEVKETHTHKHKVKKTEDKESEG